MSGSPSTVSARAHQAATRAATIAGTSAGEARFPGKYVHPGPAGYVFVLSGAGPAPTTVTRIISQGGGESHPRRKQRSACGPRRLDGHDARPAADSGSGRDVAMLRVPGFPSHRVGSIPPGSWPSTAPDLGDAAPGDNPPTRVSTTTPDVCDRADVSFGIGLAGRVGSVVMAPAIKSKTTGRKVRRRAGIAVRLRARQPVCRERFECLKRSGRSDRRQDGERVQQF
jgi:hypothetical protein